MKKPPKSVAFHGITLHASRPEALARRLRAVLGWPTLVSSRREIILGNGPELFIQILRSRRGQSDGVSEIHLAVEDLSKTRRKTTSDPLGGEAVSAELDAGLHLTLREFQRAPARRWRRKRP